MVIAQLQGSPDKKNFCFGGHFGCCWGRFSLFYALEQLAPKIKINRAAIIRIDQAQVPQFSSLVEVGHARTSKFEQCLAERIQTSKECDVLLEKLKVLQELRGDGRLEQVFDEMFDGILVGRVWISPACVAL